MEREHEEALPGLSLVSVVRKAAELEQLLGGCKSRAKRGGWGNRGEPSHVGVENASRLQEEEKETEGRERESPLPHPQENEAGSAWQQLMAYIVALEKQVQHYRSVLDELQQTSLPAQDEGGNGLMGREEGGRGRSKPEEEKTVEYWDRMMEDGECRVLLLVFSHLTTRELCVVSRVCRRWRAVSRHPLLWRNVSITETVLPRQVLLSLGQLCTHTERLTLHGLMPDMAPCDEDLQSYIARTRGSLEGGLSHLLSACSLSLSSLTLTECNLMITHRALWLVSVHCPQLQQLTYCSDEFPPTSEALWALANGCPQLQSLSLPPCEGSPNAEWFTDQCLYTIAQGWPHLLSLSVGGRAITSTGIAHIAQQCVHLRHLELIRCTEINSQAAEELCKHGGLSSLHTLTLTLTPSSPKALLHLINHCPHLSSVELHVSLHTFFPDPSDPSTHAHYEKVLTSLRRLESHPRAGRIFQLHEHTATR